MANQIVLYRHQEHKDLYLLGINTASGCQYKTTSDFKLAVDRYLKYGDFKDALEQSSKVGRAVDVELSMPMEQDGYTGILTKEEYIPLSEFERLVLEEPE